MLGVALSLGFDRKQVNHLFEDALVQGGHFESFLKGNGPRQLGFFGDVKDDNDSVFVEYLVEFLKKEGKVGEQMDDFLNDDEIELSFMELREVLLRSGLDDPTVSRVRINHYKLALLSGCFCAFGDIVSKDEVVRTDVKGAEIVGQQADDHGLELIVIGRGEDVLAVIVVSLDVVMTHLHFKSIMPNC